MGFHDTSLAASIGEETRKPPHHANILFKHKKQRIKVEWVLLGFMGGDRELWGR